MNSVETLLSNAERAFLARHQIAVSQVVDARGLGKQARSDLMRSRAAVLAIGAPCEKQGHRLRISPGHCAVCDPKKIAFARRHRAPGQVYVARSSAMTLTKIGSSVDANGRVAQLNSERYGGAVDWRLIGVCDCNEAGRVEYEAHAALAQCRAEARYRKAGLLTNCYELFACPPEVAMTVVQALVGQSTSRPVDHDHSTSPRTANADIAHWRKGDKVSHPSRPEWGIGTVLANGDRERLEVRFANGGDRVLCPSLSNLQLVEQCVP
ncbi:DUF3553 domain-containing protein [Massilia yuzhufengensis]|uniref:T5orf172 domain-containing protein n=1 Tax=Massilia yuzhufengensis TaxID=1164594 RepID=A0A1I1RZA7_9BURK|nr:T5orf172 domain-containing protein [Massilia yuzhufengensis]